MNVTDILFSSISNLTGGLITDIQTAMIGLLAVSFLVMGFDYIKDVFEDNVKARNSARALRDAQEYRKVIDNSSVDPAIRDVYKTKYRNAISRAAR